MFRSIGIRFGWGLLAEFGDVIRPIALRRSAQSCDTLHTVADLRARVRIDRALHAALVVIDKKSRRREFLHVRLLLIEFNGSANGICRTAAELALVVDRRTLRAQVNTHWSVALEWRRRSIHEIPLIGEIWNPPKSLNFACGEGRDFASHG